MRSAWKNKDTFQGILCTFMGGKRAKGACPCASSSTVMPKDQMSASAL